MEDGRNTGAGSVIGMVSEFMELQPNIMLPNTHAASAL
jgi:hypothetical protein